MGYSLAEAAKASDKSKMTIQRAIKSGKISALRRDDGSYDIDPSELHRVYPAVSLSRNDTEHVTDHDTPNNMSMLRLELKIRDEKIAALEAERERERKTLDDTINDLRHRLDDAEAERREKDRQLTALLTDQREKAEKGFWARLFGK
ncbi:MAG: hypothetical protein R3D03_12870 [Geminicoccaceae bacterium]